SPRQAGRIPPAVARSASIELAAGTRLVSTADRGAFPQSKTTLPSATTPCGDADPAKCGPDTRPFLILQRDFPTRSLFTMSCRSPKSASHDCLQLFSRAAARKETHRQKPKSRCSTKYLNISFFIAPSWQFVKEEQGNVKLLLVKYLPRPCLF